MPRRRRWWIAALLAAVVLAAYWPVTSNGFVEIFDDGGYISKNEHVLAGLTWEGVKWAFAVDRSHEGYSHPLTWLSLMLDVELFGPRPEPIHAVNVLLHLASALLVLVALTRLTGRFGPSSAVAFLFAAHPLTVEAVAWAVERKSVLSAAFGFGALAAYAAYVERPGAGRYLAVLGLFVASLLAKPTFVMFPFLLALLDFWPLGRTRAARAERPDLQRPPVSAGRLVVEKVPLLGAAVAVTVTVMLTTPPSRADPLPLGLRIANAFTSFWEYVGHLVWPFGLAPYYPQPLAIDAWKVVAAGTALLAVLLATARRWSRSGSGPTPVPGTFVGWLWFIVMLLPAAGLVRSGLWPRMADRFAYVPMIGFLIAAVWTGAALLARSAAGRSVAVGLVAALVAVEAAATNVQVRRWRDGETLFRWAVAAPEAPFPMRVNLGMELKAQGRDDEAKVIFEELIRDAPGQPEGHVNLGMLLHESGDLDAARAAYLRALRADPRCDEALYNLGLVERKRGRFASAALLFERAIREGRDDATAYNQLGTALSAAGRADEAERAFREALLRDTRHWHAGVNLARLLVASGRTDEARRVLLDTRARAVRGGNDPAPVDAVLAATPLR